MQSKVGIVVVVLAVVGMAVMYAQTTQRRTAKPKATAISKAKTDSIAAAANTDSLKRIANQRALADSIKRADSLAKANADSARVFRWRKIENSAFIVGERLVFDVRYGPITAGEAVMAIPKIETVNGRDCYRVEFTVRSLKSFDWIYEVRDRYLTFIDTQAIAPVRFEQRIREGTYRRDFTADFDQVNNIARTSEGDFPIPEYVHDILSSFYYARTLGYDGMKRGEYITLFNFYKDTSHELRVKFLGRQELEVTAGTFKTIVVEPLVKEGGLFKAEGRIVIWLSDDERKIPIRVNTKVTIGSIDVELREYAGLAGALKSKIK